MKPLQAASSRCSSHNEVCHAHDHGLGPVVQYRWKRYHFDEAAFADVAVAAMVELGMHESPSLESIVDHVLTNDEVGPQPQIALGEPPMTLFQTEQFYIEVLPWLDGTTAVHQHCFSGAFTVLHGSSIHTRFAFEEQRHYSDYIKRGALRTTRVEILGPATSDRSTRGHASSLAVSSRRPVGVDGRTHSQRFARWTATALQSPHRLGLGLGAQAAAARDATQAAAPDGVGLSCGVVPAARDRTGRRSGRVSSPSAPRARGKTEVPPTGGNFAELGNM